MNRVANPFYTDVAAQIKAFIDRELIRQKMRKIDLAAKAGRSEATIGRLTQSATAQVNTICDIAVALGYRLILSFEPLEKE